MSSQFILANFSEKKLFAVAEFFSSYSGTCFLYSGGNNKEIAKRSFLGLFPFECVELIQGLLKITKKNEVIEKKIEDPWKGLEDHFFCKLAKEEIAFGWFGYGLGASADATYPVPMKFSETSEAYWQLCHVVLIYDHQNGELMITVEQSISEMDPSIQKWLNLFQTEQGWHAFFNEILDLSSQDRAGPQPTPLKSNSQQEKKYIEKVLKAQDLICAGEIYQVNLSQTFTFFNDLSPFLLFRHLCEQNPSPFSVFFHTKRTTIISNSPERFLQKTGEQLETRPIKGTIRRGSNTADDNFLKETLLSSPKERAELLMITDLMRNDLGRISQTSSVKIVKLWDCEAYTNVFHLVSVIRSVALRQLTPIKIIRACFPGGSITGCPKLRAMEVIEELENEPRGIYTGSIGYICGNEDFDLNIAIRTLVIQDDIATLKLGSGIVYDSIPHAEYQETLDKGVTFLKLLQNGSDES